MRTLAFRFNDIVDKIFSLPLDEKVELKNLLEHNIAESRRDEIESNYKNAKEEEVSGKLKYSSAMDELRKML